MNDLTEMQRYLVVEKQFIEMAKWFEGIRLQRDPTDDFIMEWISTSAAEFRRCWNASVCKDCKDVHHCGHLLKNGCENLKEIRTDEC